MEECLNSTDVVSYELRERQIREQFHSLGFTGSQRLLKLPLGDIIVCVHLTRGTWMNRTHMSFGVFFPEIASDRTPKTFHKCHITFPETSLPDERMRAKLLAVLDGESTDYTIVLEFYLSKVEPFICQFKTLASARSRILMKNSGLGDLGVRVDPIVYQ